MRFDEMIAHIRAGGRAKRAHWQWANIAWSDRNGPHRGDMAQNRLGHSIFTTDDWVSDDWQRCTEGGVPLMENGKPDPYYSHPR